jgi:short-subunit dehydrogenase
MSQSPVILITGASSGIGAETAKLFAQKGYRVVIAARRESRLISLADQIKKGGGQALAVRADVSIHADIQHLVQESIKSYGQIDILFNNAGFGRIDWLENLDPQADVQSQIQVNLIGLIWVTQAVLPLMIDQRGGHIINMASAAGMVAAPTYCVYAASKFGIHGFSEALRRETGIYGIKVSGIYPGGVDSEFSKHARIHRKTGATTPRKWRLSAKQVAKSVWQLSQHPRRTLVIPWPMQFVIWGNHWFPALVDWVIKEFFVIRERVKKP